jgi:hypothetical protein
MHAAAAQIMDDGTCLLPVIVLTKGKTRYAKQQWKPLSDMSDCQKDLYHERNLLSDKSMNASTALPFRSQE